MQSQSDACAPNDAESSSRDIRAEAGSRSIAIGPSNGIPDIFIVLLHKNERKNLLNRHPEISVLHRNMITKLHRNIQGLPDMGST
ncbi:hypothetical protein LVD17_00510 [Fulvivirga ulvae]|uniref:hypothetical protein n=1 Tax=Fulvivirga ulvae TaxID=2904245 RepID=UPI001F34BD4E|nr:hypothetical protein [Fulvivirga ulvae]UII32319.1 hypothetical protein LVD17_00510 [Fulvivirga ulvae]